MVGFVQYLGRADYATSAAGTGIAYKCIWPLTEFEVGPVYKDRLISLKT